MFMAYQRTKYKSSEYISLQHYKWDVAILINQFDWPVSLARPYTKVIIKLKVLDTLW